MNIKTHGDHISLYKQYISYVHAVHEYLQSKGYLQLDLPVLSPALIPESYLEVFETEFRYMDRKEKLYLTPSPELFIKRLLAEGIGDCYYLGSSFRNSEPNSPKHLPEFTMLELYKVRETYKYMAKEVLEMLRFVSRKLHGSTHITYNGKRISLDSWEGLTVAEAFQKYASVSESELFDTKAFLKKAAGKGYVVNGFSYEDVWSQMYTQEIEQHLGTNGHPTVLYDYPVCFAALSTPNPDGKTAQRFEFYIEGVELGNCYSELTDTDLQDKRLSDEYEERKKSGKIDHPIDRGFVDALRKGLPVSTGIAIGVERLGMVLLDAQSIEDLKLITIS
ncbi:hypothetical protein IPM65_00115 [Candidatus Roizmanbacteria bacterium]|nr:MAG: hypothetical protein IPM65_00115 [Candidatus Roizmanbacteria bacterium]